MKVYILTVYDAPNYGSFLQAYATKNILEGLGYKVYFIKYRNIMSTLKFICFNQKNDVKHPFFSIRKAYLFKQEQNNNFKLVKLNQIIEENYKIFIGSDELWNVKNDKYFKSELFYGKYFDVNHTMVLSISCNESQVLDYPINLINLIKKLKYITYRDEHTREVISNFNENIEFCCDPTLMVNKKIFFKNKYTGFLPKKYMLVYTYDLSNEQEKLVKKYCNEKELSVVSLCNPFKWADYNINCSPLEFANIIKNANAIVTTTFHGSIFSILNNKNFICLNDTPKIKDLLKRLCLEEVIYKRTDYKIFCAKIEATLDYKKVNSKLEYYAEESIKKIKTFLDL